MLDIDTCAEQLADFVSTSKPRISGPHEIAYGFGWAPTVSYWIGQRRVHLHDDLFARSTPEPFAVEIADLRDEVNLVVHRCHVTDTGQIRDIMDRFLCQDAPIDDLSEYKWISDGRDSDKRIPDPPNRDNSANFAGWAGGHVAAGGPPEMKRSWWKLW